MIKSKFLIVIQFLRDETGKSYELESIKLKTKPMTLDAAKLLAVKEAEQCWKHYVIELESI